LAAIIVSLAFAGGCAIFHQDFWTVDHYRDARAVDIDHRLDRQEPIVKNPF
jgi:hypothetical protein